MRTFDVAIVGAGPAGSIAAYHLAKAGLRAVLLERSSMPRDKTCGGGVVLRARREIPIDWGEVAERECYEAELSLGRGLAFVAERSDPLVTMVRRRHFDAALARTAAKAGAEFVEGFELRQLEVAEDRWALSSRDEVVAARFVIGADGVSGRTARLAGFPSLEKRLAAIEWEAEVAPGHWEHRARIDFSGEVGGYTWSFPKRGHRSLGLLAGASRREMRSRLLAELGHLGATPDDIRAEEGFVLPVRPRRGGLCRSGVLLVGDAAGLVDPLTGEGISHAISSGQIAAASIVASDFDRETVQREYGARMTPLLRELSWARLLARALYGPVALRRLAFRRAGRELTEFVADLVSGSARYSDLPDRSLRWIGRRVMPARR